jgi:formylglycine-generating enzyme required for sulfatase activity
MHLERPHFTDSPSALRPSQSGDLEESDRDSFRLDKTDLGSQLAPRTFSHYELLEGMESEHSLSPFLLDQQEVTVSDFLRKFHNQLLLSLRNHPELMRTPDFPLTGLFFDEAVLSAEMVGKRLPTAQEYDFAATNGWTTRFPCGDADPPAETRMLASFGVKEFDRVQTDPPIQGLFSNASEFVLATHSPVASKHSGNNRRSNGDASRLGRSTQFDR